MQSGRRFFITGWRASDPVAAFAERLARATNGALEPLDQKGGRGWLYVPQDDGDVTLARGLCAEYDVAMCLRLAGQSRAAPPSSRPRLLVDSRRLTAVKRYGEGPHAVWGAQAGCTLGTLVDLGLAQFAGLPADLTLSQWASTSHDAVAPGESAATGVIGADVLFADGTVETLGGFGTRDTRPLRSARVQAAVPALFEITRSADARMLRAQPHWPPLARLDAMMPDANGDDDINVARLFLGNQGRHGWVLQWLVRACDTALHAFRGDAVPPFPDGLREAAHRLDGAIGQVLDPGNLYGGATAAP